MVMKHIDKVAHLAVSYMLASLFSIFFNIALSIFLVFLIGMAKEIYDGARINGTGFSWPDLLSDMAGLLLFTLKCYCIQAGICPLFSI